MSGGVFVQVVFVRVVFVRGGFCPYTISYAVIIIAIAIAKLITHSRVSV